MSLNISHHFDSIFQNLRNRVWRREKSVEPQDALFPDIHEGDIIIPVMGPTGVGKSTFINHYLEDNKAKVGHGYDSCTTYPQAFYTPLEPSEDFGAGRRLVLVDTPGFDSTCGDDFNLLQRIALCLTSSYGEGKTCGGLIHLYDMTDAGVRSMTSLNFQAYKRLCGKKNFESVVFATATPGPSLTPQAFARREQQHYSEVYPEDFKEQGATFFRLTHTHELAKDLVSRVLERIKEEQRALLIQEELVEIRKTVPTTKVGRELKNAFDEIMAYQKEVLAGEVVSQEKVAALAGKIAIVSERLRTLNIALSPRSLTFFGLA